MSTTVRLDVDGPREPGYVLEVAEAAAECMRVLNHLTMSADALTEPAQADRMIRCLATAASRLPQLLRQADLWLRAEHADGRVTAEGGTFQGRPDRAVAAISDRLAAARDLAARLQAELDAAAELASHLGSRAPDGTR